MTEQTQTLIEHLVELRRRLVWIMLVMLAAFFAVIPFAQQLYTFVAQPLMASLPPAQWQPRGRHTHRHSPQFLGELHTRCIHTSHHG